MTGLMRNKKFNVHSLLWNYENKRSPW